MTDEEVEDEKSQVIPNRRDWRAKGDCGPRRMQGLPSWASHRTGHTHRVVQQIRVDRRVQADPIDVDARIVYYTRQTGKIFLTPKQRRRMKQKARKRHG